jgi:exodeoxyribonuclease VII large subunit
VIVGVGHESDFTIADFAADRRAATPTAAAELAVSSRQELLTNIATCARSLARELRRSLEYAMQRLDGAARRLLHPAERLRNSTQLVLQLEARLAFALAHRVHDCGATLARLQASLAGLDPTAVLARGYSITRDEAGELVLDAQRLREGERLSTTLARGRVESQVTRKDLL